MSWATQHGRAVSAASPRHPRDARGRPRACSRAGRGRARRSTNGTVTTWGVAQTIGTLGAIAGDAGDQWTAYDSRRRERRCEQVGVLLVAARDARGARSALARGRQNSTTRRRMPRVGLELAQQTARLRRPRLRRRRALRCGRVRGDPRAGGRLWGAIEDEHVGAPLVAGHGIGRAAKRRLRRFVGVELDSAVSTSTRDVTDDAVDSHSRP